MIYINARAIIERIKNNKTEIVVQRGNQEGKENYEFPGSLIKEFESFFDVLKHGIKEETGLDIVEITGLSLKKVQQMAKRYNKEK